jgi:hypothetical protein
MTTFANVDHSFNNESAGAPVTVINPTTGSTYAMVNTDSAVYVSNSATLAALTILMKSAPRDGEVVQIGCQSAITALTVHDYLGNAIAGAPTAGAQNAAVVMRYIKKLGLWVHWK